MEIIRYIDDAGARLTHWFADAQNGIAKIVTDLLAAKRVETQELCVGAVCVTEDQFMQVFSPNGMPAAGSVTPLDTHGDLTGQASSEEGEAAEESGTSEVPAEENAAAEAAAPQEPPQSGQQAIEPVSQPTDTPAPESP